MDDKLKNSYFAMCYTAEFAERFSLPAGKAMDLSPGLKAIAIEIRPAAKLYHTYIHLYIDSDLKVYAPNGKCCYYNRPQAEWFFPEDYNNKDRKWYVDFLEKAVRRIRFRSKSPVGVSDILEVDMFRREFLPGLTLLSTKIHSDYLNIRYGPCEILVQKNDVGDYFLDDDDPDNPKHPENFYVFKLPAKLHRIIQAYLKHIDTKFMNLSIDARVDYLNEFPKSAVDFP
jgi:hypothetical protein